MYVDLANVLDFLWTCCNQIVLAYFAGGILSIVFATYIVKKVSRLFDIIVR